MGTDITLYLEKRRNADYWEGVMGENPQIKAELQYAEWARNRGDEEQAKKHEKKSADIASGAYLQQVKSPMDVLWYAPKVFQGWVYNGRNYDLFAILGNVRNGSGFAGVVTGDGFNYISDSRGLPENVSEDVDDAVDEDFLHSISYVTLQELLDFDWQQTTTHYGIVGQNEYLEWRETGKPNTWSGGISGGGVVHVSNGEMEDIVSGNHEPEEGKKYYTKVSWEETYADSVGDFYTETIPKLKELSDTEDGSDIRLVFGFDS